MSSLVELVLTKLDLVYRAILGALVFLLFFFVVPGEDAPLAPSGHFDYVGAYLGVAGLVLFNLVWT